MNIYVKFYEKTLSRGEQTSAALELLDFALMREFVELRGEIIRSEYGKPYFKDSDIFFSYSHCKNAVACAVSKSEIGVDIELIREVKPAVIKRVCCENELKIIKNAEDFIKIWTMKEAFAKFTGRGFAQGFKSVDTTVTRGLRAVGAGDYYAAVYPADSADLFIVDDVNP